MFWLFIWTISSIATVDGQEATDYAESFARRFFFLIGQMAITYWTIDFLFPRFFLKKKYVLFTASFLLSLVIATLAQMALNLYVYHSYIYPAFFNGESRHPGGFWSLRLFLQSLLMLYPTSMIALFVKAITHWYQSQQKLEEVEKRQLYSEIKYLQSQIHPHFFLNTLNNLYGLALQKSDVAPEVILQLSDLMKYMLYDANTPKVPLEKEVHHIQNYIELEKIRYNDGYDIFFKQRGDFQNVSIAPLLLLPFVENAFKHGLSASVNGAWISIDLETRDNFISFKVENSRPPKTRNERPGLGLANVKRRLDLLYAHTHQLEVCQKDDLYSVSLTIPKLVLH
ncbi:MAG TPA: histidine kinase [Chitinophagaceae bacterium]|nr:histidine kinase [Chitinophagaceae bacterium]